MDVSLTVETGRPTGSSDSRRLRASGMVPGVVYGMGSEPRSVSVAWPALRQALSTEAGVNALIDLTVDGESALSMVTDLQRHPVRRDIVHVDFMRINADKPLSVDVPVHLHGEAEEVENKKGMIDQLLYTLTVNARPGNIPNQLDADISHLDIGTSLLVSEIALPEGVTTDADPDESVAVGSPTRSTVMLQQEEARKARIAAGEATEEDLAIEAGELDPEDAGKGVSAAVAEEDGGGDDDAAED